MSKNPVHIYRALLRECTYLPDPNSQTFIKGWVSDSFRRYLPRDPIKKVCKPISITPQRASTVLRRGRHLMHILRRANEGYTEPFEKVLRWTYARTGKRKRVMIAKLTGDEEPTNEFQESDHEAPIKFSRDWKPSPTIMALLRSQHRHQEHMVWQGPKVKPDNRIPAANLWGNPMPECRIRNNQKKWLAKHLNLLQPPLPDEEYKHIKVVARGEKKLSPIPRRPTADVHVLASPDSGHESVLTDPPRTIYIKGRPKEVTARFIRRRMARLLIHVPFVRTALEPGSQPIAVKWESGSKNTLPVNEVNEDQAKVLFG